MGAARVMPLDEARTSRPTQTDQGHFFKLPDWMGEHLCNIRATGAMWAIVQCVGRKTRWDRLPQSISLRDFVAETRYPKQSVADGLAKLVGSGVLHEEADANKQHRHYALVDLSLPTPEAVEGKQIIPLLGGVSYPVPEGVLNFRTDTNSYHKRKNSPKIKDTGVLKSRSLPPKIKDSSVLDFRTDEARQPAQGEAPTTSLDYDRSNTDRRDERGSDDHAPAPAVLSDSQTPSAAQPDASERQRLSEETQQGILFSKVAIKLVTPPKRPKRGKKEESPEEAAQREAFETRKAQLAAIWLAHRATVHLDDMSPTQQRGFYAGIAMLARSNVTLEELPRLIDTQAKWSKGTYTPEPAKLEASLGTLRKELRGAPAQSVQTSPVHPQTALGASYSFEIDEWWNPQKGADYGEITTAKH